MKKLLVVLFMTAKLTMTLGGSELLLIEHGQTQCPTDPLGLYLDGGK